MHVLKQSSLKLHHFSTKTLNQLSDQLLAATSKQHDIPEGKKKQKLCGLPLYFLRLQGLMLLAHKEVVWLLVGDKTQVLQLLTLTLHIKTNDWKAVLGHTGVEKWLKAFCSLNKQKQPNIRGINRNRERGICPLFKPQSSNVHSLDKAMFRSDNIVPKNFPHESLCLPGALVVFNKFKSSYFPFNKVTVSLEG